MSQMSNTVLEASIPKPTLQQTLDTLGTLVNEAIWHISDDGLRVTCVDPVNVAMHDLHVTTQAFDLTPSGQYAIGVNLESVADAIDTADADQSVLLSFDPQNRMLRLEHGPYTNNLASIDPDSIRKEPDIPDLDLANEFAVTVDDWADAIKHLDHFSDHVEIRADPDSEHIELYAEGDTDDATVTWDDDDLTHAKVVEETEALFSMEYLEQITNGVDAGGDAEIRAVTGSDFPVELHYEYAEGDAQVQTNVAPRIQT